jgi:hypothetical protein
LKDSRHKRFFGRISPVRLWENELKRNNFEAKRSVAT